MKDKKNIRNTKVVSLLALCLVSSGVLKVWGSKTPLPGDITVAMQGNKGK